MIIVSDFLVNLWGKIVGIKLTAGFTLPPFCFLRKDATQEGINHEYIHLFQGNETFIILFYIIYLSNYLINRLLSGMNHYSSYRNVCFEREAFDNENNLEYLFNRKIWSFLKK